LSAGSIFNADYSLLEDSGISTPVKSLLQLDLPLKLIH